MDQQLNEPAQPSIRAILTGSTIMPLYAGLTNFFLAYGCILFANKSHYVSIWVANAVLLIFIFRSNKQHTRDYFKAGIIANALANFMGGGPILLSICLALINSLEILLPILLVPRETNKPIYIRGLNKQTSRLAISVVLGCLLAAVGATLMTVGLTLNEQAINIAFSWFTVDLLAMIAILPIGLAVTKKRCLKLLRPRRLIELIVIIAATMAITWVSPHYPKIRYVIILMPLLYAAFRLGLVGASMICFSIVSIFAINIMMSGSVNTDYGSIEELIRYSFLLMCITLIPGLMIAILIQQRDEKELVTRQLQIKLKHQATHDSLTGLINRRQFEAELNTLIDDPKATKETNSLLFLDLDNFKQVNDTAGHIAGDELLRKIAEILTKNVRSTDFVARLGGDEFAIILPACSQEKAISLAEGFIDKIINYPFTWDGHEHRISISVGLVSFQAHNVSLRALLNRADISCYAAKKEGGNRIHIFTDAATDA